MNGLLLLASVKLGFSIAGIFNQRIVASCGSRITFYIGALLMFQLCVVLLIFIDNMRDYTKEELEVKCVNIESETIFAIIISFFAGFGANLFKVGI
jgi:hypothetical protein